MERDVLLSVTACCSYLQYHALPENIQHVLAAKLVILGQESQLSLWDAGFHWCRISKGLLLEEGHSGPSR